MIRAAYSGDDDASLATFATIATDIPSTSLGSQSLYGRDKEIEILKTCFQNLTERKHPRQVILISGYSGTGKSALASSLEEPARKCGALIARGKFDCQHSRQPYFGIAMACQEICGTIFNSAVENQLSLKEFQKEIALKLGSELPMLVQVVPALEEIISEGTSVGDSYGGDGGYSTKGMGSASSYKGLNSMESKQRITFAFQSFLRLVAQRFESLVLIIDDLQWADVSSLDLLDKLVSDRELEHVLFIGTFRSNEVDAIHPLSQTITGWRERLDEKNCILTEMEIGNLDVEAIHYVVQDMLSTNDDPTTTLKLAELCFKKTHGNVFFLRLLLVTLQEKKLLYYKPGKQKWSWDRRQIEKNIPASDNVVDLLKAKMSNLQKEYLDIIKLSACLGSTFSLSVLITVLVKLYEDESRELASPAHVDIPRALNQLVVDGFLERRGGTYYRFLHDKVQESSSLMIPEAQRREYNFRVGVILLETLRGNNLHAMIFVVVDLLNEGTPPQQADGRLKLSQLNCQACRKAFALSAFKTAANYAARGIRLLEDDDTCWSTHYTLALDLHSMGAEAESFLGGHEAMNLYCDRVLAQKDRPLQDKFRVYHTLIDSIANKGELEEAARRNLELLEQFDCRFPKNKMHVNMSIVAGVARIKLTMKSWSYEGIGNLKLTEDPVRIELCRLLDKLSTCLYLLDDDRMPLVIFRNLEWTRKYGINPYSTSAVATTGLILAGVLEDFAGGATLGKSALRLLNKIDNRLLVESRVIFVVHAFILHWSSPLADMLKPLKQGYEIGLKSGDTESAGWSLCFYITMLCMLGTPLEKVDDMVRSALVQMKDLKRIQILKTFQLNRQVWLTLMGKGTPSSSSPMSEKHTQVLGGYEISAKEVDELRKNDKFFDQETLRCECVLFTYFGAHKQVADLVLERNGADIATVGSYNLVHYALARGVSCFAAYRQTKHKGYLKMGTKMRSKVKSWFSKGNPNVEHLATFLEAEFQASKGNMQAAIKYFESTVALSLSAGHLLDVAFASERFGELHLEQGNVEIALPLLREAIEYYRAMDACGKVHQMEGKYANLMPKPKEILTKSIELGIQQD